MKGQKASELRDKSVPELQQLLEAERGALYKARRALVFRQLTDTSAIRTHRHNIARLLTLIGEKQRGNG